MIKLSKDVFIKFMLNRPRYIKFLKKDFHTLVNKFSDMILINVWKYFFQNFLAIRAAQVTVVGKNQLLIVLSFVGSGFLFIK